jgi:hypothetical protein
MPSFIQRFHIDQYGEFNFVFTRIHTRSGERFSVKVLEGKRKVCQFIMQPVLHYWMITEAYDLPVWMTGIEIELEKVIKQHYGVAV